MESKVSRDRYHGNHGCEPGILQAPDGRPSGQKHPEQWHNQKDETYHILYGDVTVELDGTKSTHKSN